MLTSELLPYCRGDHYAQRYARYEYPGAYIRDATGDLGEMRETMWLIGTRDMKRHTVADIGAGVGTFGAIAAHRGARSVLCVEPEECRHKVVARQAKDRPIIRPLRAALGPQLTTKSMTFTVEDKVTLQHGIAHMPLSSLSYIKPSILKVSALGAGIHAWDAPPATARIIMLKVLPLREDVLGQIQATMPNFQMTHKAQSFAHTPRVWYVWEKVDA